MTTLLAGYARTPFVKALGQFATIPATKLGAHAITAALAKAGVSPALLLLICLNHTILGASRHLLPVNYTSAH